MDPTPPPESHGALYAALTALVLSLGQLMPSVRKWFRRTTPPTLARSESRSDTDLVEHLVSASAAALDATKAAASVATAISQVANDLRAHVAAEEVRLTNIEADLRELAVTSKANAGALNRICGKLGVPGP